MSEERKCSKGCGRTLGAANKSGICSPCQGSYKPRAQPLRLGEHVRPTPEATGPDWQKQFFQLAEALGLNPEEMLNDFCRGWVEDTRAKALGRRLDIAPETPAGE